MNCCIKGLKIVNEQVEIFYTYLSNFCPLAYIAYQKKKNIQLIFISVLH